MTAVHKDAVLSEDGRYRYLLSRRWGDGPTVLFAMLNPSTADADVDDPTIRRCMGFARTWGFHGIYVWNIYAYRATDPNKLDRVLDPVGVGIEVPLCGVLENPACGVARIVAAWGAKPNRGKYTWRERSVLYGALWERDIHVLGLTKAGHPRHPLYVKGDTEPTLWQGAGEPGF